MIHFSHFIDHYFLNFCARIEKKKLKLKIKKLNTSLTFYVLAHYIIKYFSNSMILQNFHLYHSLVHSMDKLAYSEEHFHQQNILFKRQLSSSLFSKYFLGFHTWILEFSFYISKFSQNNCMALRVLIREYQNLIPNT